MSDLYKYLAVGWSSDPISVFVGILACVTVMLAMPMRRGFPDLRFVIVVFGGWASIGTLLKTAGWVLHLLATREVGTPPGGTDWVLISGGAVAILFTVIQQLIGDFSGDANQQSGLQLLLARWWPSSAPQQVEETDEAKAQKQADDDDEPKK